MPIILFLLSKTQNYMFMLYLYQQETIKNYQNFLAKDLKDQSFFSMFLIINIYNDNKIVSVIIVI